MNYFYYFKFCVYFGISCWIFIIFLNNLKDKSTNYNILFNMFSMSEIKNDRSISQALTKRSIHSKSFAKRALLLITLYQFLTSIFMLTSALFFLFSISISNEYILLAIKSMNISLLLFTSMWIFFICGGLYFGYWIKTPQYQQMHFNLLKVSILIFLLINYN
ncbi:DUF2165 family protein [Fluviispira multicolorata]|uniref:DUF2165 family protein n=1 Tax=Fluviispira multicolorata TaxID=2654512 RepID=A0A833N5G4_9BACT|nr:DUF2165 family protein [Fluviispira multicolorata]KAB8030727.1 DUF2165 family protein [Fluviispira multicolorata]